MDGFIKIDDFKFDSSNTNLQNSNEFITKELMNMSLYEEIKCNSEEFEEMLPINNEVLELYCEKCNSKGIYIFAKTGIKYSSLEKTSTCGGEVNENNIPPGYKRMMQENQYFYFIAKAVGFFMYPMSFLLYVGSIEFFNILFVFPIVLDLMLFSIFGFLIPTFIIKFPI